MKLKQLGLTLALAGMLSTQAYAHEAAGVTAPLAAPAQEAPAHVLTQADLVALFGAEAADKPMQLAVLSQQEMRETEGAWTPILGFGLAMFGHFTARTVTQYYVSRIGTVLASYELASWLRRK